jgi:RNA polymerase sigma factor (sigma-70 family)
VAERRALRMRTPRAARVAEGLTGPSDEALLAGIALGDEQSTVAFVRRYQRRVYGLALGVLNDSAAAEDVAQEALVRAWRHASIFDPRRGSVESWVLTITRNLSIDALRRRRDLATDPGELVNHANAYGSPSLEDSVATRSMRPMILRALGQLPSDQQRAVVMASLYGRTAAEIADIEGIPLGTAKTRIRTGLLKLRDQLDAAQPRTT